jgi:hypothetical protein
MLVPLVASALVAASCAGPYAGSSQAQGSMADASLASYGGQVRVSYFYDALDPWGHWVEVAPYGWCWSPAGIAASWSPYMDGTWAYTDYGWTWISDEPWGWATCHYGRWFYDDTYGWMWVPGTEWAPAWVAWRYDTDWVGWAPLPPGAGWDAGFGLSFTSVERIPPRQWCFVPIGEIGERHVRSHVVPMARNVTLLERTRDGTRFDARGGRPFDRGLDPGVVERRLGRPIPRLQTADVDSPGRMRRSSSGNTIGVFRPALGDARPDEVPRRVLREREAALPQVERDRRREEDRRRLESDLANERARLEQAQRDDLRQRRQGAPPADMARRHAREQREFNEQAVERRRLVEQRWRPQPERGKPAREPDRQKPPGNKGRGHGGWQ